MTKYTTIAPANIAFIKYWGRKDNDLFIPLNNNISMSIDGCTTKTTIELVDDNEDSIKVKFFGKEYINLDKNSIKAKNIFSQIERIRKISNSNKKVFIMSENNFPADAGIASSASSFAAITSALLLAYGLKEKFDDKKELSRQIRLSGSASAVRSAYGGFVEMLAGKDHESTYAVQIADESSWDLVDIIAVLDTKEKKVSSSEGHEVAFTSPYLNTRISEMHNRIIECRKSILKKDFSSLGKCIEADAISMHLVMMTSNPPIYYWNGTTIEIIKQIVSWREEGLESYFTIDAGANVHIICRKNDSEEINNRIKKFPGVLWTILNNPSKGVEICKEHLF